VKLSAALIVKNDHHVIDAIRSIRPGVDEVVVVDTGSTDGTPAIAQVAADKLQSFSDCNFADGAMRDFSAARRRSFEIASHDAVVWLDSDDLVEGAEHLPAAVAWCQAHADGQPWRAQFPYEYEYDADGVCVTRQLRERIVAPKSAFHWVRPVHEGLTSKQPTGWLTLRPPFPIVWKHQMDRWKNRSARNLRILREYVKHVGGDAVDPKTAFDYGVELARTGDQFRAIGWLSRCFEQSEWDEERLLAAMHLVDVYGYYPGCGEQAERWAHRAIQVKPDAAEGYWALAKLAYVAAKDGAAGERRQLERAVHFGRKGFACGAGDRQVPLNPTERSFRMPWLLQDALARLGEPEAALEWARVCAEAKPDEAGLALRCRELAIRAGYLQHTDADVVIACGHTIESWDPKTAAEHGIGGSETAVIEMAKRLAASGCRVRVFCRTENPGLYDGVEYRAMSDLDAVDGCDVFIAWRNAGLLESVPAKVKWLWAHDTGIAAADAWRLSLADRVLSLSKWHSLHLAEQHPEIARKIEQTRNGIELSRFDVAIERNPHKAIYSSSPDRGLDQLLEMWPAIRARVPDAQLHVFYGSAGFAKDYRDDLYWRLAALAPMGVIDRGRVDQGQLAREMLSAGVWLYPSWSGGKPFTDTSCISAMEAQAAGMRVVSGSHGALPETAKGCDIIPGDATTTSFQDEFVIAAIQAMTDGDESARDAARARATRFTWNDVAAEWRVLIAHDLGEFRHAPSRITDARDHRRTELHCYLAPQASGNVLMDARHPGGEAYGGGSRVGFLGLVQAMARLGGYRVRAFSTFTDPRIERDGVEYVRLDHRRTAPKPDVVLAYYDTSPLAEFGPDVLRIASHHTYTPYMHFEHADVNVAPSQVALEHLRSTFEPSGPWYVLPNAVGEMPILRRPVPGRILYHTSPDRGLHLLLDIFPEIRKAVPNATLHVVGPVAEMLAGKDPSGRAGEWMRMLRAAHAKASDAGGLTLLGRLSRSRLDHELAEASVFAFPCAPLAPCETFSVSVMECCRIGLPVVLSPADALGSIYRSGVRLTSAPAHEHMGEFRDAVVHVLTDEAERRALSAQGRSLASGYTFERSAATLDRIIRQHRTVAASSESFTLNHAGRMTEGDALSAYV
jgi:glycosyltransferase involved in cell wall biosynthesis